MKTVGMPAIALALCGCLTAPSLPTSPLPPRRRAATSTYTATLSAGSPESNPIALELQPVTYRAAPPQLSFCVGGKSEPLSVTFVNRTAKAMVVEWDRSALVEPDGQSHRIIHGGVKLSDRNAPQAPSVIAPGGKLTDIIVPVDCIRWLDILSQWHTGAFLPGNVAAAGQKYSLLLGVATEGKQEAIMVPIEIARIELRDRDFDDR